MDMFSRPINSNIVCFAEFKLFLLFLIIHTILTGRSLNSPAEFMCILVFVEVGRRELKTQTEDDDT